MLNQRNIYKENIACFFKDISLFEIALFLQDSVCIIIQYRSVKFRDDFTKVENLLYFYFQHLVQIGFRGTVDILSQHY